MSKLFFIALFVASLSFNSFVNAEFKCPTDHITKDAGLTGVIPAGATDQIKVPANTNCTYIFDIPKGFALKMETSADFQVSPGDDITGISPPAVNRVSFAVNTSYSFDVVSVTGNLTFISKYSYIDLTNYQQVIKKTGEYFNSTLEAGKYYTIQASKADDQVNLNYGSRENGLFDHTVYEVFVFDGNDIVNSKYMGRVTEIFRRYYYEFVSTSNTVTLLNLYNTPSDSLFLGNDASVMENLDSYGVLVVDSNQDFDSWIGLTQDPWPKNNGYFTVICDGCTSFTINSMMFESNYGYATRNGYVGIQGLTPTDKLPEILNYPYSTNNNGSFPQIITSPMATLHLFNASIHLNMSPGSSQQEFATAPGQSRSVYSPQLLDPTATPSFDYTFTDPVNQMTVYNFSINLENVQLLNVGDELDVQVGSLNGLTTLDKKYTNTKVIMENISGMGRYLKLKYSGSKTSEVVLNFMMIDPSNPDGTTQSPETDSTTNQTPVTTVSTTLGTSVSTRATRVSTSTIAPITSTIVSSTATAPSTTRLVITSTLPPVTTSQSAASTSVPNVTTLPSSTYTKISVITKTSKEMSTTAKNEASSTSSQSVASTSVVTVTTLPPSTASSIITSSKTVPTQTTTSHVETTTKGASSLLPTGLVVLVIFLFSFLLTHTVQSFVCPDYLITPESGPIGVIPISRVGLSVIPANYDCAYHFLIYPGWALHFSISTHYDQFLGDNITFTDNLGEVHALPTPNQHIEEWSSAPSAVLHIKTMTNTSQMFAIYEFVNVEKKYQHVMVPTGEYFALGDMKNRYYTFHSEAMDRILLNLAVKNTQDYDTLLEFLFVYDGGDVKNCPMIGKLSNFLKKKKVSTWPNITIVNFYDVKSPSYLIGNDWSKVSVFSKYKAILTSRNQQTTGELFDASDQGAAYTWICSDCNNFYWTVLKFHKSATTITKAYIELRSLSPTHNTSTLLNYTFSTSIERNFPQLIPTRMFTMINHNSGIAVTLDTSVNKSMTQKWLKPFDGRRGTIFSPSLWDPNTSPSFSYQFEDHNQKFMFGVNVKDVRIAAPGESLTIKTGPTTSSNFSYKEFVSDHTEFWTRRESKGNFMQIAYDGWDRKSMAIVSFDMKQINSGSVNDLFLLLMSWVLWSFMQL